MRKFGLMMSVLAVFALGACSTIQDSGDKEKIGGVSGAVIGGILGSKVGGGSGEKWATGAGAVIGAVLGSELGRSLDKADMVYASRASQDAHDVPVGETVNWNNPESGNSGAITPVRDGYSSVGRYCREYQQTITVGGRNETAYGTACQQPDGSWEIID